MADTHSDVTCVIPTFNRDTELRRAVESALAQTRPPRKIIIVDDASDNFARQAIDEILGLSAEIEYIVKPTREKRGASASRNLGAANATTRYLAFLDDDDQWDADYLEDMVDLATATHLPLVVSWGRLVQGSRSKIHNWQMLPGQTATTVARANPGFTGSNFLVEKAAFTSVGGFDEWQWVFNDLDFLVRFLSCFPDYVVLQRDAVTQNSSGAGHLSSRTNKRAESITRFVQKHEKLLSRGAKRRHLRSAHIARISPENSRINRYWHTLNAVLLSAPSDHARAIWRRVKSEPRY